MRSRFAFFFSEAIKSLSTNKATSLAAIVAMLVALVIVGVGTAGVIKLSLITKDQQQRAATVKVFLKESASEEQVNALVARLDKMDKGVPGSTFKKVWYVDKTQALAEAKKQFKDSPGVVENLQGNPFPASVRARLADPTPGRIDSVKTAMKGQDGVDSVEYGGDAAEHLVVVARWVIIGLVVIGILLLIAGTVMVGNTIRLSIYARRREIEVMKLVGASNGFVRMPFMIEGMVCGVLAAAMAIVLVLITVRGLPLLLERLTNNAIDSAPGGSVPVALLALGILILGVLLGAAGSLSSTRRYMKV